MTRLERQTGRPPRHGLRSPRLPDGCQHIERTIQRLRVELAKVVAAQSSDGQLSLYHDFRINSVARHETRALLAARWLYLQGEVELALDDRLKLLKTISDATEARDRCLKELHIDAPTAGLNVLDARFPIPPADDGQADETDHEGGAA